MFVAHLKITHFVGKIFYWVHSVQQCFVRGHLLRNRTRASKQRYDFTTSLERNTNQMLFKVHADDAEEFLNMRKPLISLRITLIVTLVSSPTSNRLSGWMDPVLMDKVRALLKEASSKDAFWSEDVLHTTHLLTKTTTSQLMDCTPHKALLWEATEKSKLRIFWCSAYVHVHKEKMVSKRSDHVEKSINSGTKNSVLKVFKPQ